MSASETKPSEPRPSERAMKAAVSMEVHAACSTQTIAKARELDTHFPAYDDMLAALKEARTEFYEMWHPTMSQEAFDTHPTISMIDAAIYKASA